MGAEFFQRRDSQAGDWWANSGISRILNSGIGGFLSLEIGEFSELGSELRLLTLQLDNTGHWVGLQTVKALIEIKCGDSGFYFWPLCLYRAFHCFSGAWNLMSSFELRFSKAEFQFLSCQSP